MNGKRKYTQNTIIEELKIRREVNKKLQAYGILLDTVDIIWKKKKNRYSRKNILEYKRMTLHYAAMQMEKY
jgi:hypothetical protein